jgi:poly-gamma-glutamate synthesis protein (capsule biosynthesis protein)
VPFAVPLVALVLIVAAVVGFRLGDRSGAAASGAFAGGASPSGAALALEGSAGGARQGAPSPRATPSPSRGRLVIHGTGDVSLDPSYLPVFGSRGYGWAWSGLDGLFRRDDLTLINLECPATHVSAPVSKQFVFRCDPAALPAAKAAGVEVANQSNNHAFDQGAQGLLDSLKQIRRAGLVPVGAGANQAQALRAVLFELNGWRVAVVGIDEVIDPEYEVAGPDSPGTAAGHDFPLALQAVRDAARRSDLVVVMIHWGVELDARPRDYQVQEGHRLIDAGADVIYGGHSHRLQPMETYRGHPIFYSLGNFVWPRYSAGGSTTAVAEVTVSTKGRIRGRLLPASIASDGHPVLTG